MGFQQIVQNTSAGIQAKAPYGVAVGVGTTPIWVHTLTDVAQLIAVLIAIAVGGTTFYMNMKRIKFYKDKEKN